MGLLDQKKNQLHKNLHRRVLLHRWFLQLQRHHRHRHLFEVWDQMSLNQEIHLHHYFLEREILGEYFLILLYLLKQLD